MSSKKILSGMALFVGSILIAEATPYRRYFFAYNFNNHPWGVWQLVDRPTNPADRPYSLRAGDGKLELKTYWCFSFGPYAYGEISKGSLQVLVILLLFLLTVVAYLMRQKLLPGKMAAQGTG